MAYSLEIDNRIGNGVYVFLDNRRIDTLRAAGKTEYPLDGGPHIFHCRIIGRISEIVRIGEGAGGAVRIVCDVRKRSEFLKTDDRRVSVLAPARENPTWVLVPILLMIEFLFASLVYLSMPAERWTGTNVFWFAAVVLAFLLGLPVLGLAIARKAAARPLPPSMVPDLRLAS